MPDEFKFVIDTNVMISALLLKESVSRKAFNKALAVGEIVVSDETIDE